MKKSFAAQSFNSNSYASGAFQGVGVAASGHGGRKKKPVPRPLRLPRPTVVRPNIIDDEEPPFDVILAAIEAIYGQ